MNGNGDKTSEERCRQLQRESARLKKIILILLIGAAVVIGAAILTVSLMKGGSEETETEGSGRFYPVTDGNIFENEDYLGLNRQFCYSEGGETRVVTEENRNEFNAEVLFLYDFLQTVINGDADAYNACFNEEYFRENSRKGSFTQQMLYNITVSPYSTESEKDSRLVTYRLDYMIYRNNGTFRRDVGSDAIRPQFAVLRVSADGKIGIERLVVYRESK